MRQTPRRKHSLLSIFVALVLAGEARAQSESEEPPSPTTPPETTIDNSAVTREPRFGDQGEYVISGSFSASLGHLEYSDSDASTFSANFEPSFDYFVAKNLSLGAAGFIRYSDSTSGIGTESKTVGLGAYARVGANLPMGEVVSLWPVFSLGVWHLSTTLTAPGPGFVTSAGGLAVGVGSETNLGETVVVVEVFAPILLPPARHFFLGLGPDFYTDLVNDIDNRSNKRTFLGISSTVGGWF